MPLRFECLCILFLQNECAEAFLLDFISHVLNNAAVLWFLRVRNYKHESLK